MATPWQVSGCTAPAFYEELWETDQRAAVKFESIAVWSCMAPTFQRCNVPFGLMGYVDDSAVDDYLFVQKGTSPPPKQVRDVGGLEPLWAELRDETISLAKAKIPAQCSCCCLSCLTVQCWMPCALDKYKAALQGLVDEKTPKFAAVGVDLKYFDKSGLYSFKFVSPTKTQMGSRHFPVFGFTLEKGGAAQPVAAVPVQIERD